MAPHSEASSNNETQTPSIDFVTLGMFIIDDIDFLPPTPPVKDILGGAGTYSALGARLLSPASLSSTVGWIVDKGSDFPPALSKLIDAWSTHAVYRRDAERLTTRGWNGYETADAYTGADLDPVLLQSKSFHLICSPLRCQELVRDITHRRRDVMPADSYTKPIFIWEPPKPR
ncbi:hypothetical protein NQ176_g6747 [Zarea fungicola]|uniref:Uncharacterized protein n=1 Tax=Zarea fungicola TaxID=93591 RepID=A0ACC1N334_9HYPO|nr:hypothetical protein NQ176_g6747 [Lecanicillium fungicola]